MFKRLTLSLTIMLCALTAGAQSFAHYVGHANSSLDSRGMQRVSEVHYYYYVSDDRASFALTLPLEGYTGNASRLEPRNYFRWYDYRTDRKAANLTPNGNCLKTVSDAGGTERGLFAWSLNTTGSQTTVGVTYTPPAGANAENWEGDVIACDVSRYNDFGGKGGTMLAEPTLSIRYIYHILSGRHLARQIVNTTSTDLHGRYADLTIEDNRRIVFGAKNASTYMHLRTTYPASRYYFYPLRNATTKHVYAATAANAITSADFNTSTMRHADAIQWRAYDQTKTKYTILATAGPQMIMFTAINTVMNSGNGWKTLNGQSTTKPNIGYGSIVYFVAYAVEKATGNMAPIANFEVLYQNTYPKTRAELIASGDNERMVSYLDAHYQQAMKPISFDDDNGEMEDSAPTTPDNNMSRLPSKWDRRSYGFTYRDLKDFVPHIDYQQTHTPVHGEYGLYKSANLKGVSDLASGYIWWDSQDVVFDRTYELSGGRRYGHFLYIDASDESRQIAAADFKANLCSGAKLIFSGAIADITSGATQPQVIFRLYGIIRDENDSITDQRLITSFSSGDFAVNISRRQNGKWFQVYSKMVLPRGTGVENYSDFRIVMDNMCPDTKGADYLIDDLRLYIQPAKVDVLQNKAVCPSEASGDNTPGGITLKIRSAFESLHALVGDRASHVFYRICDEQGNPVEGIDYDGDGKADSYGIADVPDAPDTKLCLPPYAAGGRTDCRMFENDSQNDTYLVLADRYFPLKQGQHYYVSVAYPDDNDESKPGTWGVPTNVCSTYSPAFEIVKQDIIVSDANGNVVTAIRVSCDANRTPDVKINARLETADLANGGKVSLGNICFDWFFSENGKANDFTEIDGLQQALRRFRDAYPTLKALNSAPRLQYTAADYALLKTYVDSRRLVLSASNTIDGYRFDVGTYSVAAIPIAATVTTGGQTYDICPDPMYFALRIVEDGPKLTLGFKDVIYPSDSRTVRIGLPQIRAMKASGGCLTLPVSAIESARMIEFTDSAGIFIDDSNDPTWTDGKQVVGHIVNPQLEQNKDENLSMRFDDCALTTLHEGYWYELNFSYRQRLQDGEQVISCPGNMFITFKIVPEYLTWNSSQQNSLNANWNNDANWLRSTAEQIYKTDYTDYGQPTLGDNAADTRLARMQAYVPMKFSKVTVADQTGRVYPDLGNIVYRDGNQIATKLTNSKGEAATENIAYDIAVKWNKYTPDHSDTGDGNFSCEKFQGNTCDEIYFKPHAELLDACYLTYNRAYAEKELATDRWYIASSPLRCTYAGDMYVPASNGRQQTEAFKPIAFDGERYSRTLRPIYQRRWDGNATEVVDGLTFYNANDYAGGGLRIDTLTDQSLNVGSLYWSHVYNRVDDDYSCGRAFSLKAGDEYTADGGGTWLLRLPKDDGAYLYYDYDGKASETETAVDRTDNYRLAVEPSNADGTYSPVDEPLDDGIHSADRYRLVGNPYTATVSIRQFLKGNPEFENKIWTLEAGHTEAFTLSDNDGENDTDRRSDVLIEPMQAFFVKLKDGSEARTAHFTTAMTVDRWVSGGTETRSKNATMTLTASANGRSSSAKVVLADDADNEYDEREDAELLAVDDLDNIPQVYTVASDVAVAVNRRMSAEWLPVGVTAKQDGDVELTVGMDGYAMNDSYWLFDSRERTFAPLTDGTHIRLKANAYSRYYITTAQQLPCNGSQPINCYSPGHGTVTVSSPTAKLNDVEIYGTDGICIASRHGIAQNGYDVCTGKGLFIVKATDENGRTMEKKIAVE